MTKRSPYWKHFIPSNPPTLFKGDKFHQNVYCTYCVDQRVHVLQEFDELHRQNGEQLCLRSLSLLQMAAIDHLEPTCAKSERFLAHIKACKAIPSDTRLQILLSAKNSTQAATKTMRNPDLPSHRAIPPSSSPFASRHSHLISALPAALEPAAKRPRLDEPKSEAKRLKSLTPEQIQGEFEDDVCEVLVATNTAWSAADNPRMRAFVEKWVERPVLMPSRRTLSGRILDRVAEKADKNIVIAVKSDREGEKNFATGQTDGWKNVAKASLVSSAMTVKNQAYLVTTHDVSREAKTGDNLLKLVVEDIKVMEDKYNVEVVAWCTDDGPDGKKMRRLLQVMYPWLVTLVCWAHQINLVVGDFLGASPSIVNVVSSALEIVKWFNNHGTALNLVNQEQFATYNKILALLLPAVTRWTAHYLAITRLLALKIPIVLCWTRNEDKLLICAGNRQEQQRKAEEIRSIVGNIEFWTQLKAIQQLLEPLAIAANITQAPNTRLDVVLLTLGNLHRIYSKANTYNDLRQPILDSLEKRWAKVDQDIYITAVFLNPYVCAHIFRLAALTEAALYMIVEQVYERLLRRTADLGFEEAFADYRREEGEFTRKEMRLESTAKKFENAGKPIDLYFIWSRLDNGSFEGRNGLVKLAMRLLSIIANSAGCERIFSSFGVIHNQHRNRLEYKKVHKTASMKLSILRQEPALQRKRKFGEPDTGPSAASTSTSTAPSIPTTVPLTTPTPTPQAVAAQSPTVSDPLTPDPCNFAQHAAELVDDARLIDPEDNTDSNVPEPTAHHSTSAGSTTTQTVRVAQPPRGSRQTRKTAIPLSTLFDYSRVNHDDGLGFYWKGGLMNLAADVDEHEQLHSELVSGLL